MTEPKPDTAGGPDDSVMLATIDGRINAAIAEKVDPLNAKIDALTKANTALVATLESAKSADAKPTGKADASGVDPRDAVIATLTERLDAIEGAGKAAASTDARRAVLLKLRPGLAGKPRVIDNVIKLADGDDETSVLAALETVRADYEEAGADTKPFASDFKAQGGEVDTTSADNATAATKRWEERASAKQTAAAG